MSPSPSERTLIARIAATERWSREPDRAAATAKARQAFRDRFEKQVDPDGVLEPAERAQRAESARKAFYTRLALRSAQSRRKAAEARHTATILDQEAEQADLELLTLNGDEA